MDKGQAELLLHMFEEYENYAKDSELIIQTIRKSLDGNEDLESFKTEIISGHIKELLKNLQGIDDFIESAIKNQN